MPTTMASHVGVAADLCTRFPAVRSFTGALAARPCAACPRVQPAARAVGEYDGGLMVDQHVVPGSACVTPAGHGRLTYRNFCPPGSRWPFTRLWLADDR